MTLSNTILNISFNASETNMNRNETILLGLLILLPIFMMWVDYLSKPDYSKIANPVVACYAAASSSNDKLQCKDLAEKLHVPLQSNVP